MKGTDLGLSMESESMNYPHILDTLKRKINQAKLRAVLNVNAELLGINWEIGRMITLHEAEAGWGAKIIDRLAEDLRSEFPDMRGFSSRNLRYMREFYQAYPFPILQSVIAKLENERLEGEYFWDVVENEDFVILQSMIAKLPWTHHVAILIKVREAKERLFYIQKCIENGWSRVALDAQIDTKLHLRQGSIINNFSKTLPKVQSDLVRDTFKNPYIFDFLSSDEKMQERDLENALIQHLKKFMLELGKGFAYVGNQYRLQVEGDEFVLDLLFYNYILHAFVLFELKLVEFEPEFAGKLNFYINAVDGQLKGAEDKPTIGVLLCKTPNSTVVKYALKGIDTPMGISEYELAEALPQQLKGEIPSIAELEAEMDKEYEELKRPIDQKLDRVKAMMLNLQQQEVKEARSPENVRRIFEQVLLPLKHEILASIEGISSQFQGIKTRLVLASSVHETDEAARAYLQEQREPREFQLQVHLRGCIPAGTKAFDIYKDLAIRLEDYRYLIGLGHHLQEPALLESLYHELPSTQAKQGIVEAFTEALLDDLEKRLVQIMETGKR